MYCRRRVSGVHKVPAETIVIAADHGGVELKALLVADLHARGFDVLDLGTDSNASVDYPDYAQALAAAIVDGRARRGVLICGSGIGMVTGLYVGAWTGF